MDRRDFLLTAGGAPLVLAGNVWAKVRDDEARLLVIIDFVGGNDGLNTVIPFADPSYRMLRPAIAVACSDVLPVSSGQGLHPALRDIMPLWQAGELAIVQGVGSPLASLSHHRAAEIMDSAAFEDEPGRHGWLGRSLHFHSRRAQREPQVLLARAELPGPLYGARRCVPLDAAMAGEGRDACARLGFPEGELGGALARACAALANGAYVSVIHASLHGFDTHENQPAEHARLLLECARSISALRRFLQAAGRWDDTLVMTRSEFGRRAYENLSAGTDHGAASVQFLAGGRICGGLHGTAPDLLALDARGGLRASTDFRSVCAAVAQQWLGLDATAVFPDVHPVGGLIRA
ncbi:MAG: DUF1501 domain-containing protein [Gammaproteobacteria bacterium]|nr:DUF1501 domain-containing protein [Gammaproteobacteria bacterium]MBU0773405.1 DUF1501 domain-containing protein [Gammaproteobacteria bacterium]MBU0857391.1 DUF1501 domain-containing protein [Gammaproteobacteria bacterium]MBU1846854.1 DUF1501 domain-containing protein [Gammaproteobacteria bacterium]